MASAIIHLAVAKKVLSDNSVTVDNQKDYYLGSIAPDLSKQIGLNKIESHFLINTKNDIPNMNVFKKRYPFFKYNSFDLGYFTHLYTDKLWAENFLPNIVHNSSIKLLDGTIINSSDKEFINLLYSDYTNLNIEVIDEYEMDLSLFYEDFQIPDTNIKEIPIDKLDILVNKMGLIIENSKGKKTYTFDIYDIKKFIDLAAEEIINELKKY